jgi:leucine dehydrogenase
VLFGVDHRSGLRTIVAIHSTALGPALGGTRFYPYHTEEAALEDVLRLSKGMTYKSAAAGLDLGGGKAVIIGDPGKDKSERLFRAYGSVIDSLGGRYITAEDVGTTMEDMVMIRRATCHVSGLPLAHGGSGDPSPATARGVRRAMEAVADYLWSSPELSGKRIAVQGGGKVGMGVVDHAVTMFGAKGVELEDIYAVDSDIYSPCALGATLNERSIPLLRTAAVVGSANNQLETEDDADRLQDREILYAPDFVANAGGVINIATEREGYSEERAAEMVDRIFDNVQSVLRLAAAEGINTNQAAQRVAEKRIEAIGTLAMKRPAARHDGGRTWR